MKRILAVALVLLSLAGCVGLRSYRTRAPHGPVETPPFLDQDGNPVHIGFVELDDHGLYWTDRQITDSMQMVDDAARPTMRHIKERGEPATIMSRGVLVVVFVHGWLNNARYPDKDNFDVNHFKTDVLAVMSQHETTAAVREGRPPRNVVGVYVAWRGLVMKGPLAYLSFYNRKDAALRVADTQATVTLHSLISKTREHASSQILVIGHSFGGLITERALGPVLITEAMRARVAAQRDTTAPASMPLPYNGPDLVVLVNPATNATRALGDVWTLKDSPELVPQRASAFRIGGSSISRTPLFISITSATDWATGIAFPAGEYLSGLDQAFRSWSGTPMEGVFPSQRTVYAKTMGHLPQIWSHDVTLGTAERAMTDAATERAVPCSGSKPPGEICFAVGRDQFTLAPRAGRFNDTHYWIMQVPKTIINGHSDVWNPVWVRMLIGMMEALGPPPNP